MKAKRFTKKLVFKRLTIANLKNTNEIKGGRIITKGLTKEHGICVRPHFASGCISCAPCC